MTTDRLEKSSLVQSSSFVTTLLLTVVLGFGLKWGLKRIWTGTKKYFWNFIHLEEMKGPRVYPIIGNVPHLIYKDVFVTGVPIIHHVSLVVIDFYKWSQSMCKNWGDPLRLWVFGRPMVFISSYKYAIQLLSQSNFNGKLSDLDMIYRQPGGKGLSTTPADVHPQKRKMLNAAFSRQIVEGSVQVFSEETIKLVDELNTFAATNVPFDMVDHAMKCLFRMVARSDFGDNYMEDGNDTDAIQHMTALHVIADNISKRILGPYLWLKNDFIYYNFTRDGKATRKAVNTINSFATGAIQKRRQYRNGVSDRNEKHCYLDILLDLVDSGMMTDDDVVSELNNFMGGAYDTTALTVCWTLFLLALNPEHQQKVYEELVQILEPSHIVTANDTKQMKYLELCLKESLRLFPPAPIFPRRTVDDMTLADDRIIPGGVDVFIFANLIHRDPTYFPNPEEFLPERHLDHIPAYMPFSIGVRNCIGQTYGMYQSKVVLAYLIRYFDWTTEESMDTIKISYQGLLYPANGLKFKIKRRV